MPATISVSDLASSMLAAAKTSFASDWPKARDFAKPEFSKLAQSLADIGRLYAEGQITEVEARSLLEIHKNTTRTVLLTIEGLGLLAVENAINAALAVVRDSVNTALGFGIL